jgi:hypothetical protein
MMVSSKKRTDSKSVRGDVRSKTTGGESGAGVDALGGDGGRSFGRSKNSAGRCAKKKLKTPPNKPKILC